MDPTKESVKVPRPNPSTAQQERPQRTALDPTSPSDVQRAVDEVVASTESLYRVANDYIGRQIDQRPYAVLGGAAALGFVLGGGLASRLGGVLATFGTRTLVSRLVEGVTTHGGIRPPPWE